MLKQESLPSSYKSFLYKHGGNDLVILQGVKDIASGMSFTDLEAIKRYYKAKGVDVQLDPNMEVPCSIIHENQSCGGHFLSYLLEAYKRALSVYLPVYLIPALLVHRQIIKRPQTILAKGVVGTARSKLISVCLLLICLDVDVLAFQNLQKMEHSNGGHGNGGFHIGLTVLHQGQSSKSAYRGLTRSSTRRAFTTKSPTGLALGIEKKSRRMEISLYCFARAIESFFACLDDVGYLPQSIKIKRDDVLVFGLSTAIIMHCYACTAMHKRGKYLDPNT